MLLSTWNTINLTDKISTAHLLAAAKRDLRLQALPITKLKRVLDPETFHVAISLQVCSDECVPHTCRCGRLMDAKGIHGLSCKYSAGRHPRHAALNDVVKRALRSAGISSILEPVGIDSREDGRRPVGISVFHFFERKVSLMGCHIRGYFR